jgi:Rod binding domain-containing protein
MTVPAMDLAGLRAASDEARFQTRLDSVRGMADGQSLRKSLQGLDHEAQLRKASDEFVSVLFGQMFRLMDQQRLDDGMVGFGGSAERTFRDMSYEEYGRELAGNGSFGLGELVYQSLARRSGLAGGGSG